MDLVDKSYRSASTTVEVQAGAGEIVVYISGTLRMATMGVAQSTSIASHRAVKACRPSMKVPYCRLVVCRSFANHCLNLSMLMTCAEISTFLGIPICARAWHAYDVHFQDDHDLVVDHSVAQVLLQLHQAHILHVALAHHPIQLRRQHRLVVVHAVAEHQPEALR